MPANETTIHTGRKCYIQPASNDPRRIQTGHVIPTESYSDQPYVVRTDDGCWLLTVTTGGGEEGSGGQHVISMRSADRGKTWSEPVDLEPADGPEASYAVLLKTGYGRVYCFYNHNTDNIRSVKADNPPFPAGKCTRVDSLGHYVFRYTDDNGRSWSKKRYDVPMRLFEIDRENADRGKLLYFWNVGKPFCIDGEAFVSIHKVGGYGEGVFTRSEGALLLSPNILTERDPEKLVWQTLPEGEIGLCSPAEGGPIAEEQSYVVASDGSIHVVYRTVDGFPAQSVSRNRGRSFAAPAYRTYADGRPMKHPRAANFMWRCENGKYLYWFHNHGGRDYEDRNPVWLCGGIEADTPEGKALIWSQPEILLYDDDPMIRMSYPDFLEENGRYFFTETQKDVARIHEIDPTLLEGLWGQLEGHFALKPAPLLDVRQKDKKATMPILPSFSVRDNHAPDYQTLSTRCGFTLALDVLGNAPEGALLFTTMDETHKGIRISVGDRALILEMGDGVTGAIWHSDPFLLPGHSHQAAFIVDGGHRVILCVVDGILQDGGTFRQFGFGRFSPWLNDVNAGAANLGEYIKRMRVYGSALRVSAVIGMHCAAISNHKNIKEAHLCHTSLSPERVTAD